MLLECFEDTGLSQYSYAVGCPATGEIAIVDPRRDLDVYVEFAAARRLRITEVLETHIHADFASGARELAARTGARLSLSAYDHGEAYEVSYPHGELHDGDAIVLGSVRIEALHTPGHTPEHLSFLVYDLARSAAVPMLLLSGDFLFVGSLGRPDLLGEEAKQELAGRLHASVASKLSTLPDGLEIHPGHGAGSLCGAGMSGRPVSTLGYERATNPYLDSGLSRAAFIGRILNHPPPFPAYYHRMKALNSEGPPPLGKIAVAALGVAAFRQLFERGQAVLDVRGVRAFGAGHLPGSLGIGADDKLAFWAGWLLPAQTEPLLLAHDRRQAHAVASTLSRVGFDRVAGYLDGGLDGWRQAGYPVTTLAQAAPSALAKSLATGEVRLLDVRDDREWQDGHAPAAIHVPLPELTARLGELQEVGDRPLAVVCGSGYRSTIAASLLERAGFDHLINVGGGMTAWREARLPLA